MKILPYLCATLSISLLSLKTHAMDVEIGIETEISSPYHDCQPYADNINELIALILKPENVTHRAFIHEQIGFLKKILKKCEKKNDKKHSNTTVKIGLTKHFSKKD